MPKMLNTRPQNGNHLLNQLLRRLQLRNDAALCRMLQVAPPHVSKIRHGRLPVTAALLLQIYDKTSIPIDDLRALLYYGTEEVAQPAQAEAVAA